MKTKSDKLKILILVLVLLSSMIFYVSAESLLITDVQGNQLIYAVKGEKLTILISSDGQPVAGADVYFKLNDETPIHTSTNDTGIAVFKPLSTGILKITAGKDEKTKEIEIRVIQKESILQIQVPSCAIKGDILVVKVIANDQPVVNADTYFKLNEGAPVHVMTNETGIAVFKPLVTGTLKITAQKDAFEPTSTSIPVFEKATQIFDTGAGTYPSIMGIHNGTITPSHNVTVNKMYTYPCSGTGGHSEYVWIYGNGINESATWNGYQGAGDYHYIEFSEPFTLEANITYNYTIKTGSYPQIHHNTTLTVSDGEITCTVFIDANGKIYYDWIPAIRLDEQSIRIV
jgi:hypothetical protein